MNRIDDYLFSLEGRGVKLGLEETSALLNCCGDPHRDLRVIQVAGTNGKGSTCAMLAHILGSHGYKVGLYTSPHLNRLNERIRVDGLPISDAEIWAWVTENRVHIDAINATFFEATTALALTHFRNAGVDFAVLETGLGGRLDATTASDPVFTALTPIALDHVDILGGTTQKIALEKAGIFKPGVPCISVAQTTRVSQVLKTEAARINTPLQFLPSKVNLDCEVNLPGRHQRINAQLAFTVAGQLLGGRFDPRQAYHALETVRWPGRYDVVRTAPRVVFDVGHNPHGLRAFLKVMRTEPGPVGKRWLILALQRGKDLRTLVRLLTRDFDTIIITQSGVRDFLPAGEVLAGFSGATVPVQVIEAPESAIRDVLGTAGKEDFIAVFGTHYIGPAVAKVFEISFDKLI